MAKLRRVGRVGRADFDWLETSKTEEDSELLFQKARNAAQAAMSAFEKETLAWIIPNYEAYRANPRYPVRLRHLITCLQLELECCDARD